MGCRQHCAAARRDGVRWLAQPVRCLRRRERSRARPEARAERSMRRPVRSSRAWPVPTTTAAPAHASDAAIPSASIAVSMRPAPEVQCAPERQFAVQRQIVVGKREQRPLTVPCSGRSRPGGEADQARFAAAVRSRDLERLTRPKRQDPGLRTAAVHRAEASPVRTGAAPSLRLVLERVHVVVGKAEMMADLVDDDVADDLFEAEARPTAIRR